MKVCINCFRDEELRGFIDTNASSFGKCDYCQSDSPVALIEIEEILDFFMELLSVFEENQEGKPISDYLFNDWNLFSDNVKKTSLLEDILKYCYQDEIDFNLPYNYSIEILECLNHWPKLKASLINDRRFITDLTELEEFQWDWLLDRKIALDNAQVYYRARINATADQAPYQTSEMKCPPPDITSAGRANPQGIPYLYLSTNPVTTLYETRASFLDELSIGEFKSKEDQPIVLVDFTENQSLYEHIGDIASFVKSFLLKRLISSDLSKPIRRYDSTLDYIPTQFICEYIRYIIGADGILFESSLHKGGKNLVIFDQNKFDCIKVVKHKVNNIQIESETLPVK